MSQTEGLKLNISNTVKTYTYSNKVSSRQIIGGIMLMLAMTDFN